MNKNAEDITKLPKWAQYRIRNAEDGAARVRAQMDAYKPAEKIEEGSLYYMKLAHKLAMDFRPPIYPCPDCGKPTIDGYCCTFCGCSKG